MEFHYIVAGGGAAGCLLANRLSANPAHRAVGMVWRQGEVTRSARAMREVMLAAGALARR